MHKFLLLLITAKAQGFGALAVQALVKKGAKPNAINRYGASPLAEAVTMIRDGQYVTALARIDEVLATETGIDQHEAALRRVDQLLHPGVLAHEHGHATGQRFGHGVFRKDLRSYAEDALRWLGLVNTYWGLILVYMIITLPLSVWMLTSYFRAIPRELEEAAIIDGASPAVVAMTANIAAVVVLPAVPLMATPTSTGSPARTASTLSAGLSIGPWNVTMPRSIFSRCP